MRFAAGDDVFDVRLAGAGEIGAGVRAVDAAALLGDDPGLDTLRVRIVVGVVGRAAVFWLDPDAQAVVAGRWLRGLGRLGCGRSGRGRDRRIGGCGDGRDVGRDRNRRYVMA